MRIERAILSVSDKTGIVDLARALRAKDVEILSTGGTAKHLADNGIEVTSIAQWSGAPEILGGRVKTLTPRVFGAILFDRANDSHRADVDRLAIPPIDLVVVNLYPFEATIAKEGVTIEEAIEQIDVGGPSMLRAAAKNHRSVLPLCDPSLYADFLREFDAGEISDEFRYRCAVEVFRKTSAYDATIANFLGGGGNLTLNLTKFQDLRYGENPQQSAAFYVPPGAKPFEQIQGKELSYNNLLDLDSAMRLAQAFAEPAAAVIKHTNPCGAARRESVAEALRGAIDADPVSAFGGIIGVNRDFDGDCARIVEAMFLEVIVAPSFSDEAREVLAKKKNLRLIVAQQPVAGIEYRSAAGGILAQGSDVVKSPAQTRVSVPHHSASADSHAETVENNVAQTLLSVRRDAWQAVTIRQPTPEEMDGLEFAWIVCAHVKSNAIVLTNRAQTVGIGAGQMSRVDAAKVAIMKSIAPTAGTYAASDAFFPFRDGLDLLAGAGITAIIQPGGSMRDAEVIAAANERGLAMVFTGERHFRH
ncbi:MAG TPA: bifunctional phosphoribosylaminoimidazolecarboxamide formyltransferase/IMP cyclohydrolase [Thermoanaerobaculia bacterium]|jgi:phosphoribosylaminoimidazolecarboxamide formyltransferase/IMP cyclohydrolase|nr:bifunctional phosphoribosylaminoimidazolecarboxamide formyltransferase/IMP cyclohydrolase [Thermoanaerobaculia bacterium]